MKKSRNSTESVESGAATRDVKVSLLVAALSATVRMVVPIMGLFFAGLAVDFSLAQTAFWAIIGAAAGFVVAGFLIYLQIIKLKKSTKNDKKLDREKLSNEETEILQQSRDETKTETKTEIEIKARQNKKERE